MLLPPSWRVAVTVVIAWCICTASVATAREPCTLLNVTNVYSPVACSGYTRCEALACACLGYPKLSSVSRCMAASQTDGYALLSSPARVSANQTTSCPAGVSWCLSSFAACVESLSIARLNIADPCLDFAQTMYTRILAAHVAEYSTSMLNADCRATVCALMMSTNVTGTVTSGECSTTASIAAVQDSVCQLRSIGGNDGATPVGMYNASVTFSGLVLRDVWTNYTSSFAAAVSADLSTALGVDQVTVIGATVLSATRVLVAATFNSSLSQSELLSLAATAGGTWPQWCLATAALYAKANSIDSIAVVSLAVWSTTASTFTVPNPLTNSPVLFTSAGANAFTTTLPPLPSAAAFRSLDGRLALGIVIFVLVALSSG